MPVAFRQKTFYHRHQTFYIHLSPATRAPRQHRGKPTPVRLPRGRACLTRRAHRTTRAIVRAAKWALFIPPISPGQDETPITTFLPRVAAASSLNGQGDMGESYALHFAARAGQAGHRRAFPLVRWQAQARVRANAGSLLKHAASEKHYRAAVDKHQTTNLLPPGTTTTRAWHPTPLASLTTRAYTFYHASTYRMHATISYERTCAECAKGDMPLLGQARAAPDGRART